MSSVYDDPPYVTDYLECWAPYLRTLTAQVADALAERVDGSDVIVDLGAGTGGLTAQLLALGPAAVRAVEPSVEMARHIPTHDALHIEHCTAQNEAAGQAESADYVTIAFVFQELSEGEVSASLTNAWRMLKPGGQLHVLAWADCPNACESPHEQALWKCLDQKGLGADDGDSMAEIEPERISAMAADAGFRCDRTARMVDELVIPRDHFIRYRARMAVPEGGNQLDELLQLLDGCVPLGPARIEYEVSFYVGSA